MRCKKHDITYDSDFFKDCIQCENEEGGYNENEETTFERAEREAEDKANRDVDEILENRQ